MESLWRSGICERNHLIVDLYIQKILEGKPETSLRVTLSEVIKAKKLIANKIRLYRNIPSTMTGYPPALAGTTSNSFPNISTQYTQPEQPI